MRLGVLQLASRWDQIDAAVGRVDALLAERTSDWVLLPEASLTGYVSSTFDFDLTRFAEPSDGPTTRALAALARRHHVGLVAPLVWRDADRLHNAMVVIDAAGHLQDVYAKRHPWMPEHWASAGRAPFPRLQLGARRATLAICFDLHFLEEEASETLAWAELLLFPSAWVDDEDTRLPRLQELAARYRLWVAGANWCKGEVELPGQGRSCVIDPEGKVLAVMGDREGRIDVCLPEAP